MHTILILQNLQYLTHKECKKDYENSGIIRAIRRLRELSGDRLKEAKEKIERWARDDKWKHP